MKVAKKLWNEYPMSDPAVLMGNRYKELSVEAADPFRGLGARTQGEQLGHLVKVAPVVPVALALLPLAVLGRIVTDPEGSLDSVKAAVGSLEAEAGKAMDAALNSGYAFSNGVANTAKDVMDNATAAADEISKIVPKEGKKIINKGMENVASTVKSFSDMGKDALENAGDMLDSIGLDEIFKEETVLDKVVDGVNDLVNSVVDNVSEMLDEANKVLEDVAKVMKKDDWTQDDLDSIGASMIVGLGLEDKMNKFIADQEEHGASKNSLGEYWVKPHQRAGRAIKGFWRAARKKMG
jgi:hypothetical protein